MPRILFIKTSSLGDVVHNCPAVSDVARHVPQAVIDWVVEDAFAEIAAMHPAVRRVIPVAIRRWRGALASRATWAEVAAFRSQVRNERYDAVIDTQGLIKSALVASLAHGPRHGFDRESAREPFAARFYDRGHPVATQLHAVDRNRRLAAAALGYAPDGACDYGLRVGGDLPAGLAAPYALLLTMTSRDDKLWPEEHWRSLGLWLHERGIRSVLPWGSEDERHRCSRIAAAVSGALVPPRMRVSELARVAQGAQWVVGVDTGLAHLAAAVGVPVVGLYCGSDPALTGLHGDGRVRNLGGPAQMPAVAEVIVALESLR